MENNQARTIDELGRLLIPSQLRKELGLQKGDNLALAHIGTEVVMQRTQDGTSTTCPTCQIDFLGRIDLPAEIRQHMGWKEKDKISMRQLGNAIILKYT